MLFPLSNVSFDSTADDDHLQATIGRSDVRECKIARNGEQTSES